MRPLSLDERTLALAAAVSVDYDYFSQHSHGSGLFPHMLMPYPGVPPVPYPSSGSSDGEVDPSGGSGNDRADTLPGEPARSGLLGFRA